ncbi:hypothetical protein T11_12276 [Trichinella zimbabwensis]|uniref:Uncharacterized protein n=1 Tax=Trichinella zimbabwensis TaxID=268475 RepID=A0A0V1GGL1_9BILA|nr:hypothetical protein T11_12276 [Trichinella zimbabwensis]
MTLSIRRQDMESLTHPTPPPTTGFIPVIPTISDYCVY